MKDFELFYLRKIWKKRDIIIEKYGDKTIHELSDKELKEIEKIFVEIEKFDSIVNLYRSHFKRIPSSY